MSDIVGMVYDMIRQDTKLGQEITNAIDHVGMNLVKCTHDLTLYGVGLALQGVRDPSQHIEFIHYHGGNCDCEILMNVVPMLQNTG